MSSGKTEAMWRHARSPIRLHVLEAPYPPPELAVSRIAQALRKGEGNKKRGKKKKKRKTVQARIGNAGRKIRMTMLMARPDLFFPL